MSIPVRWQSSYLDKLRMAGHMPPEVVQDIRARQGYEDPAIIQLTEDWAILVQRAKKCICADHNIRTMYEGKDGYALADKARYLWLENAVRQINDMIPPTFQPGQDLVSRLEAWLEFMASEPKVQT